MFNYTSSISHKKNSTVVAKRQFPSVLLYLQIIEWIHLHDWPNSVERQRDVNTLIGHQRSVDGQRTGGNDPKAAQKKTNTSR